MDTANQKPRHDEGLLLGLDLGISTAKAVLFNGRGVLIASESEEYFTLPKGPKAEIDPEVYWKAMAAILRKLLRKWGGDPAHIMAVSVASHTETVIPMNGSGTASGPAVLWMDNRCHPEADELSRMIGARRVLEISGQPVISPIWPLIKFRWLRKSQPEQFRRTAKFLLSEDYLLYRLCGEMVAEQTVWSSSIALDIRKKAWSQEMLDFGAVDQKQLPDLCAPGTLIGTVSPACSAETGLHPATKVVAGALDQVCAALAVGNIAPGIVSASTGSVLALLATVSEPIFDAASRIPCHLHALPDTYCMLPWNPTGGLVLKWFKDSFVSTPGSPAESGIYERLSREAEQVLPGSDGLIMLPHLDGALFPEYDENARGVFFGITLNHGRPHFVRAIMESIAFMIRRDLEGLNSLGLRTEELRILGGGAKSSLWMQIKADTCGLRLAAASQEEAAALGAAILASVGAGLHPDIPAAVKQMAGIGRLIDPDETRRDVYNAAYELYKNIYDQVKGLYVQCDWIKQLNVSSRVSQ